MTRLIAIETPSQHVLLLEPELAAQVLKHCVLALYTGYSRDERTEYVRSTRPLEVSMVQQAQVVDKAKGEDA